MDIFSLLPQFGGFVWTVAAFVIALSIIVAIHEYGHYIVGRWSGIHADVFSIGFGPVLWSRMDKRGTRWQIAALPFGGYVKFAGDANAASGKDEAAMEAVEGDPEAMRRTMHGAPLWARAATVAAGPVFNFILSILVFAAIAWTSGKARDPLTVGELVPLPMETRGLQPGDVLLSIGGVAVPSQEDPAYGEFIDGLPQTKLLAFEVERDGERLDVEDSPLTPPVIAGVVPSSAAMAAGLQKQDVITAVDGTEIHTFGQLKEIVETSGGRTLELKVWRDGSDETFSLSPIRRDEPDGEGGFRTEWRIGVYAGMSFELGTEPLGFGEAISRGADRVKSIVTGTFSALRHIILGEIGTCNLSGPVGIAKVSGQTASQGLLAFVGFIAVLSTAIGLINLFPIPALDGGHLVFYAYEAVFRRPPSDAALKLLMSVGLAMIASLMVFALFNDFTCP